MRAAGIDEFGGAVHPMTLPEPRPLAADEVLIDVRAAGVANWEEFARTGQWDVGARPPMALGVEASGVITAVGDRVSEWSPGDAVMTHCVPFREQGAWSEQVIAAADVLAPKPAEVSWEEAAAFPVPALTAAQALDEVMAPEPAGPLLVHGAGGVTGGVIVALARLRGARVIATAGPRSVDFLTGLGVEAVLDYHDASWQQDARTLTGGVSAAVNAAPGGEADALSTMRDGGRFATITGAPPAAERGVSIADVYVLADGAQLRELATALGERRLQVPVAETYELDRAADALAQAMRGGVGGAIVLGQVTS
ncbi:MAG TPA: NADP-dependent oxidoreductase [Solirubrobacteraceae bacterium]|nr:NADP-dependent oxidoreductase [Solirubrobacteraceae bacterium]